LETAQQNDKNNEAKRSELEKNLRRLESENNQLKTDLDSENKNKQKNLKANTKLNQDLQTLQAKATEDSNLISQLQAKIKRLEEEVVEAKENTEGNNALKQKYEKEKKAIQLQLEEMNDKYDEEVNSKIKSQKLISELEEQIEELKQKLEEADVRKELEELKSRQEQELELMRFKLDRESELRKKIRRSCKWIQTTK